MQININVESPVVALEWPLCGGIPFERGRLQPSSSLSLYDYEGNELVSIIEPSVLWSDGSVKWLSIHTKVHLGRKQALTLIDSPGDLHTGESLSTDTIGSVRIANAGFELDIPHDGSHLLRSCLLDGQIIMERGFGARVVEKNGTVYEQMSPEIVETERCNGVHAQIRVEGYYKSLRGEYDYGYVYRVHAFAGIPLLRIEHTLLNKSPCTSDRCLSGSALQIDIGKDVSDLLFSSGRGRCLVQTATDTFFIDGIQYHRRCNGGLTVPGILTACVPKFWQKEPRSLSINGGVISLGLLDDSSDSGVMCAQGEAQTNDIFIWAGRNAPSVGDMETVLSEPPIMHVGSERIVHSGVFGFESRACGELIDVFDTCVEDGVSDILQRRESRSEYGYRDYGDTRFDLLPDAWLNGENDWGHAYLMQFARTGDRRYFDLACCSTLHVIDTDTIHHAPPHLEHTIGAAHEHSPHHTTGGIDIGHCWVEGMFELAALLDDTRIRAQAIETAGFFSNCVERVKNPKYRNYPGARRPGWGLIALISAYRYTGDKRYLQSAGRIVDVCELEQSSKTGAWVYPGGGLDDPRYLVGKTFMVALTLTGLKRYHEETNESRAKAMLLRGIKWAIDWMWDAVAGGFRYIDVPFDTLERKPGNFASRMLEVLAYAGRLTRDDRYMFVASRTFEAFMDSKKGEPIEAKDIRGVIPYLPDYRRLAAYKGVFPLLSVRKPVPEHVRGFCATPNGQCVAVGLFGMMLESMDDGESWNRIDCGRKEHLYAAAVTPAGKLVAVGQGEKLLIREEPGCAWRSVPAISFELRGASLRYFYDITMLDEDIGYVGGYAVVAKTEDGGMSWHRIWDAAEDGTWNKIPQWRALSLQKAGVLWGVGSYSLSAVVYLDDDVVRPMISLPAGGLHISWLSAQVGIMCDLEGSIWRSANGGASWECVYTGENALWQTSFADEAGGYACGESGTILVTRNGGNDWIQVDAGIAGSLRAVLALSPDVAIAGGDDGALVRSTDRGESWAKVPFSLDFK